MLFTVLYCVCPGAMWLLLPVYELERSDHYATLLRGRNFARCAGSLLIMFLFLIQVLVCMRLAIGGDSGSLRWIAGSLGLYVWIGLMVNGPILEKRFGTARYLENLQMTAAFLQVTVAWPFDVYENAARLKEWRYVPTYQWVIWVLCLPGVAAVPVSLAAWSLGASAWWITGAILMHMLTGTIALGSLHFLDDYGDSFGD